MTVALWTEVNYGVTFLSEYMFRETPIWFSILTISMRKADNAVLEPDNHEPSVRIP